MSFLDRIAICRIKDLSAYRPFVVAGQQYGWVKNDFAIRLRDYPTVFEVSDSAVALSDSLEDYQARTEAVDDVVQQLQKSGDVSMWFGEKFPVKASHGTEPVFAMERAATPLFGVLSFGVHLNGFVGHGKNQCMWVAERSQNVRIQPGKLDQMVAGGQPIDLTLEENIIKECGEEAAIDAETAAKAVAVGAITYTMERPEGLRCDVIYSYDLELDPSFEPANTDGEVHAFHLWPIDKVAAIVHDTDDFKFNCSLVVIDFLIRHGFLTPDHPEYVDCIKGLHQ